MTTASIFADMPLEQLEEASGELHRRAGIALRRIDEPRADDPDTGGASPRRRIAALIASAELTVATLTAIAAGQAAPTARTDLDPGAWSALIYGAPTLPGLLARLEQDRRMLASLARTLHDRLDEDATTPWGTRTIRALLIEQAINEPARCAQALEEHLARLDAEAEAEARAAADATPPLDA